MRPDEKSILIDNRKEDAVEIESLLAQIEGEEIPERLLMLAQELQHALNLRKKQLYPNGKQ